MSDILLIEADIQLKKFPGKGGWTYAPIPHLDLNSSKPFNYKKVSGFIDHYEIKETHIMPMGQGRHFVPVKAEIRKIINKKEGDWVKLKLYIEPPLAQITSEEFLLCLQDEPEALIFFKSLPQKEQDKYINWILSATSDDLKIERISLALKILSNAQLLKL